MQTYSHEIKQANDQMFKCSIRWGSPRITERVNERLKEQMKGRYSKWWKKWRRRKENWKKWEEKTNEKNVQGGMGCSHHHFSETEKQPNLFFHSHRENNKEDSSWEDHTMNNRHRKKERKKIAMYCKNCGKQKWKGRSRWFPKSDFSAFTPAPATFVVII